MIPLEPCSCSAINAKAADLVRSGLAGDRDLPLSGRLSARVSARATGLVVANEPAAPVDPAGSAQLVGFAAHGLRAEEEQRRAQDRAPRRERRRSGRSGRWRV